MIKIIITLFISIVSAASYAYAGQDQLSSCPAISQLYQEAEHVYKTRFYGVNHNGELFKARDAHYTKFGYFFAHYAAKSFNSELSRYDIETNQLICVYDIDMFDSADNEYIATLQDFMTTSSGLTI